MAEERGVRFQDPSLGNSSPWIYVWNLWALTACTGFTALRFWVRAGRYGWDDVVNATAFVFAVASTAMIFSALTRGLGSPEGVHQEAECSAIAWASNMWTLYGDESDIVFQRVNTSICLLLVTDALSKGATMLLIRRILSSGASPFQLHQRVSEFIVGAIVVWLVLGVALIASDCGRACHPTSCQPSAGRMIAVIVISVVLEVGIFGVTVWIFNQLQMSRKLKATTFGLFSLRLPLIPFTIVFLAEYMKYVTRVESGSSDIGSGLYWQCVWLAFTNIAPALQSFKTTAEKMSTFGAQIGGSTGASGVSSRPKVSDRSSKKSRQGSEAFLRLPPEDGPSDTLSESQMNLDATESFESDTMAIRQSRTWKVQSSPRHLS